MLKAAPVTFGATAYKIEVSGDRTNYAAVSEIGRVQGNSSYYCNLTVVSTKLK